MIVRRNLKTLDKCNWCTDVYLSLEKAWNNSSEWTVPYFSVKCELQDQLLKGPASTISKESVKEEFSSLAHLPCRYSLATGIIMYSPFATILNLQDVRSGQTSLFFSLLLLEGEDEPVVTDGKEKWVPCSCLYVFMERTFKEVKAVVLGCRDGHHAMVCVRPLWL